MCQQRTSLTPLREAARGSGSGADAAGAAAAGSAGGGGGQAGHPLPDCPSSPSHAIDPSAVTAAPTRFPSRQAASSEAAQLAGGAAAAGGGGGDEAAAEAGPPPSPPLFPSTPPLPSLPSLPVATPIDDHANPAIPLFPRPPSIPRQAASGEAAQLVGGAAVAVGGGGETAAEAGPLLPPPSPSFPSARLTFAARSGNVSVFRALQFRYVFGCWVLLIRLGIGLLWFGINGFATCLSILSASSCLRVCARRLSVCGCVCHCTCVHTCVYEELLQVYIYI